MRVLGLDPGLKRMGFACVEQLDTHMELIDFGYFLNERDVTMTYNTHLNRAVGFLAEKFPALVHEYAPRVIAAEIVPVGRLGANTELVVAAITVCKVIAHQFGVEWVDYGANTIKQVATGDGLATKARVRNAMLHRFASLDEAQREIKAKQKARGERPTGIPQDVFDGCAIAITGALKAVITDGKED